MSTIDGKIEVAFTHPRDSITYWAEIDLKITAEQVLDVLHGKGTGPFIQNLPKGLHELLLLRRNRKPIAFNSSMSEADVISGDILDVIWTELSNSEVDTGSFEGYDHRLTEKQRYIEKLKKNISLYKERSDHYKLIHNIIQYITICGAASIPVVLAFPSLSRWIPAIISFIIAVAAGIDKTNNFGKEQQKYQYCARNMENELQRYTFGSGRYEEKSPNESVRILQENIVIIEDRLYRDVDTPGEESKGRQISSL